MIAFGFFVITKFVAGYGPSAAAAFGVALRIEELIILPTIGLNVALVSIIGQSYGAKEYKRIREVYITSLKIGFIMMFFGSIILIFLGEFLSSLFTNDEEVIRYSKNYLYFAAIWSFLFPVVHMSGSVFLGIKKPLYTAFYAFIRLGVLPGIVIYLITKYFEFEVNGIWIGLLIINFTVSAIIFFHLKRILSRIENQIKT
jgi:Na+-driven multidrug efflux pump